VGDPTRQILALMLGLMAISLADGAELSRAVPASEILAKIEKGQPVEYDHVIITGDLNLSKLGLQSKYIDRSGIEKPSGLLKGIKIVRSLIRINDSVIDGIVDFSSTILENSTNFRGTVFNSTVDFSSAKSLTENKIHKFIL
jgi:hypothetical protein